MLKFSDLMMEPPTTQATHVIDILPVLILRKNTKQSDLIVLFL